MEILFFFLKKKQRTSKQAMKKDVTNISGQTINTWVVLCLKLFKYEPDDIQWMLSAKF